MMNGILILIVIYCATTAIWGFFVFVGSKNNEEFWEVFLPLAKWIAIIIFVPGILGLILGLLSAR